MPLAKCPDCGHDVSDTAIACPGCGRPASPRRFSANAVAIIASLVVLAAIAGLIDPRPFFELDTALSALGSYWPVILLVVVVVVATSRRNRW